MRGADLSCSHPYEGETHGVAIQNPEALNNSLMLI